MSEHATTKETITISKGSAEVLHISIRITLHILSGFVGSRAERGKRKKKYGSSPIPHLLYRNL